MLRSINLILGSVSRELPLALATLGLMPHLDSLTFPPSQPLPVSKSSSSKTNPAEATFRKVNINQATFEQLQTLPGIGPAIAQRILDYRRKNPPFRKIEELLIIRGISRDRLERLRGRISLE